MTDSESISFPRRDFLCGTAAVLGVAALGLETAPAEAAASPASAHSLSIAFWTGTRLIDARQIPAGDASLQNVRVTVQGHQGGEALRAISAYFPIAGHPEAASVPFHAWTAALGSPGSRFMMPVAPSNGVLLSALSAKETHCRLRTDAAPGQPKLHVGSYVVALGEPAWLGCHFDLEAMLLPSGPLTQRTFSGFVPVRFGYRVLTIERV